MKTFDRWYVCVPVFHPAVAIALINFCLLTLLLGGFYSFFASPSGLEIRMPRFLSAGAEESRATIDITAENVLYFDGKVVTLNDLKRVFIKQNYSNRVIYIHTDRRASLGRVADVWDLCRGLNAGRVYIVAGQTSRPD